MIRPSLESLQALLILGFVLANDMKAEASWALIGMVCRLAQALGLHRGPNETTRLKQSVVDDLPRRKLWYDYELLFPYLANISKGGLLFGRIVFYRYPLIDLLSQP